MTALWLLAAAAAVAAFAVGWMLWNLGKAMDADFDTHAEMALAVARDRHPANRARSAASDPVCRRCGGTIVGPAVEHLCLGRVR